MTNLALLDNPAWNSLTGGHRRIAELNGMARRYPFAMSPIAGLEEYTPGAFAQLAGLVEKDDAVVLVTATDYAVPDGWAQFAAVACYQMVGDGVAPWSGARPVLLQAEDVPAMVELAEATEPGPFRVGTIGMGRYYGLKTPEGRLMAMTGERMRMDGLTEVSAVCTWPEYRGKGLAATLVSFVSSQIRDEGRTPFLHVKLENTGAKSVYDKVGFRVRREITFRLLKRL